MNQYNLTYKQYNKRTILIEWPAGISENILKDVINFKNKIVNYNIKVIVDVINTYNSLTIIYHSTIENIYSEFSALKRIYEQPIAEKEQKNYRWYIPVCYNLQFGEDLNEISINNKLSFDEIISLHSNTFYTVFFIGFLPGFLYLGGLDDRLTFARKSNPRLLVDKGSVAIGGSQTGIYPMQSPGGWNVIGKTPVSFFDVSRENPCFAKPQDQIKFIPIELEEYKIIENEVSNGFYELQKSAIQ